MTLPGCRCVGVAYPSVVQGVRVPPLLIGQHQRSGWRGSLLPTEAAPGADPLPALQAALDELRPGRDTARLRPGCDCWRGSESVHRGRNARPALLLLVLCCSVAVQRPHFSRGFCGRGRRQRTMGWEGWGPMGRCGPTPPPRGRDGPPAAAPPRRGLGAAQHGAAGNEQGPLQLPDARQLSYT